MRCEKCNKTIKMKAYWKAKIVCFGCFKRLQVRGKEKRNQEKRDIENGI